MNIEDHIEDYVEILPADEDHSRSQMQEAILVPEAVLVSHHEVMPEQAILVPEAVVLSRQDFAVISYVVEENLRDEVEEVVPLVYASLSPTEDVIDAFDNNGRVDTFYHFLDRLLSIVYSTDHPRN